MGKEYFIKLDQFEGPIDLLLYLVRQNEINIFDIDIFFLANQYLQYLRVLDFSDLADAGEFISLAATLVEIKSKQLLPGEKSEAIQEDEEEEDPKEALQRRLVEYDNFRRVAEFLRERPDSGLNTRSSNEWQRHEPEYADNEAPILGDSSTLIVLYEQMMASLAERKPSKIEAKTHRVSQEVITQQFLEKVEQLQFTLFQGLYQQFGSRYELVVHILAVLELVKSKHLKVFQQDILGPMWVYLAGLETSSLPLKESNRAGIIQNDGEIRFDGAKDAQ